MPLKQLKQIIQIKHNIVKNPNWPEADQLAIYKCGRGFELGRSVKQIQLVARAGLEPGTAGLRVRRADHSATLPLKFKCYCIRLILEVNISLSHTCEEDRLNLQEDGCHPESDALLSGTRENFSELVHRELILAIQHKCQ